MIKKVIVINYQPTTQQLLDIYYSKRWKEEKIDFQIFDLTKIYNTKLSIHDELQLEGIAYFSSLNELAQVLKNNSKEDTIYFVHITFYYKVIRLFLLLTKYQCKIAFLGKGMLDLYGLNENLITKVYKKFNQLISLKYLYGFIGNKIGFLLKSAKLIKPYDIVFYSGSYGYNTIGIGSEIDRTFSKLIPINSFDYDDFMSENEPQIVDEPYIVFIDDFLPFHRDFEILNIKTVDPDHYFKSLNIFFGKIEKNQGLKVVIAAHPKSNYTEDVFEGRKTIKFKSCNLIKNASIVVTHFSTAISFAILAKKPLIFIYGFEIKNVFASSLYLNIINVAQNLNAYCLNIDEEEINDNAILIDDLKYEQYKYKFLTSRSSENAYSENIVIDAIKNYRK